MDASGMQRRACCRLRFWLIDDEQEVFTAMVALKQGTGSFVHATIAELGARAG
jgi:hypothetical protein